MPIYSAYNVGIESDYVFDALPVYRGSRKPIRLSVRFKEDLGPAPTDVTRTGWSQGRNIYIVSTPETTLIRIGAFAAFNLNLDLGTIACTYATGVPKRLLEYWILQQICPIFLLLEGGMEFLHGMAVSARQDGSGALGFLGDSYAGKSTLAEYFLSRGHALIGDDHVAISRANYLDVLPATPHYRPYRSVEDLGHVARCFSPAPTPLRRLYLLEPTFGYADIEAHTVSGMSALEALLSHVQYNLHNPELPERYPLVAERFSGLNRLVRQVPLKRLHVPRDKDRLGEVYDFIQNDLNELTP